MDKEYKFCPECGNKVEKEAKFCDACGYNFVMKESRPSETKQQVSQLINKLNKKIIMAAFGVVIVLAAGFYFLRGNFAIAGEYKSLDSVAYGSSTSLEISKKGIATIVESSEYDDARYEVGLPLVYVDQTETYTIDTDKKVALSITGPLADLGADDIEEIDQFVAMLGLTRETEGENMVLSGEIDFALLKMADIGGSLASIADEFVIVDKGNDQLDISGETFIKVVE
ncbi:zinc-ribbon domain-containing protein [Marinilactibacillus psychrotolerans]|uniref:zinc-ribbon domain-containing protein n=1 Tax=Marinilactibacillus psychrotolerans TaxID=191770 RepID=UPI003885BDFD